MESQPESKFDLNQAIQILERTPALLRSLLQDLPPEWLNYQEQPEAWSPLLVLIHLIHNEQTNWIPRARVALSEKEERVFPPFQQMPEDLESRQKPVGELLTEFAGLRRESLATLRGFDLSPPDLERQALHPALGAVNLRQLLAAWTVHDLNHTHQMIKTLAKRYRESVGPWRQFLTILDL